MTCNISEEQLWSWIDQDSPELAAHLAECPECRARAEKIRGQVETIKLQATDSSARPDERIPGYEILSRIHSGGQGVVYKAVQQATKRTVALKVLLQGPHASPRQRHRFEREVDLAAGLQHPHIVTVYDSGVTPDDRHYFAMAYIHGQPLDSYLSDAQLSIDKTLRLFGKICAAVNYAHQRGVIHRDLKPGNIRIDAQGEPHVLDFGLAKAAGSDLHGGAPVTMTGEFMGTLAYASPEQTKGDPHLIDIRTDIYSLGVILYEMLTGKYPYQVVGQMADVLRNIAEAEPKKPSTIRRQINDEVETIVLKALAKERERRYQSAENLARDIEHYLNGEPIDAKRDSGWYVLTKTMRRYRPQIGAAAVFLALLVTSVVVSGALYVRAESAREAADRDRKIAIASAAQERQAKEEANEARRLAEVREQEATDAREAEEKQRRLAEEREQEVVKSRDQLQVVTDFQASMLSEIDPEQMGRALFADLRARVRESLEAEGILPEDVDSAMAGFDQVLRRANATDLARRLVDDQVLRPAVEAIQADFADQPLVRGALQQAVANIYYEIGRYPPAMPLQEAALQTRRAELGEDHLDTLVSRINMGVLLRRMGRFEEALGDCRDALETARRVLGDDNPLTLVSSQVVGDVLESMGRFADARPYFLEAVEGNRRVLGNDHRSTLSSIHNMGVLLKSMGKFDEAVPYLREALEGRQRLLGVDDPATLLSTHEMGALLDSMGNFKEALRYYRAALEGRRRVLGDDHPDTLTSISDMGGPLETMGRLEEAMSYRREALEGYRRLLGDDHRHTLTAIANMGGLLERMGEPEEAEPYYREALEGKRRVLGDDHPSTLISMNMMGGLLESMGRVEDALQYYHLALQGKRSVLGDDHPSTLTTISDLSRLLQSIGKLEEAELLAAEAVNRARGSLPGGHWHTGVFIAHHGRCLGEMKRHAEGETALLEAYKILEASLGPRHERTGTVIKSLADLYEGWAVSDPGAGHAAQAAEWRSKLEEWQATRQPAATQPATAPASDTLGQSKGSSQSGDTIPITSLQRR